MNPTLNELNDIKKTFELVELEGKYLELEQAFKALFENYKELTAVALKCPVCQKFIMKEPTK